MKIKVAVAKGRLGKDAINLFKQVGVGDVVDFSSRKLIFSDDNWEFILVKPSDVYTYVKNGVADLGILGKDSILEGDNGVYELLDLGFGKCTISACGYKDREFLMKDRVLKVATKYPKTTKKYFKSLNQDIQIIKLNGSVELAPIVGLSDIIVDIVETGNTLRANGLEVLEDIEVATARLIGNKASYRFLQNDIKKFVSELENVLGKEVNR